MPGRALSPITPATENIYSAPNKRIRHCNHVRSGSSRSTNVTLQAHSVGRQQRGAALGAAGGAFRGCTIWLTGLSGAGKTTVAFGLEKALTQLGIACYALDGDNVRHGLCKNLGFSAEDRSENIRRVAEVGKLFADAGMVCLASFISPFKADRNEARRIHEADGLSFFEVYVNTSLEICEQRDPKKLYERARAGTLPGFTGIDSVYEPPDAPELVVQAGTESQDDCVNQVLDFLRHKGILPELRITKPAVRELFVCEEKRSEVEKELLALAHEVPLSLVNVEWLQVLAEGWATPLSGFMRERQYLQSLHFGQLIDLNKRCDIPDDLHRSFEAEEEILEEPINQSIPIVLPISASLKTKLLQEEKKESRELQAVALSWQGKRIAILRQPEIFEHRKKERAAKIFGTLDERHPGVAQLLSSGDFCLGGDIEVVIPRLEFSDDLDSYRLTPLELRSQLAEKKADVVFAFQLRNPIHNGHALLMQETRERLIASGYKNPVLLLHPLGGWTKDDDVPLSVRIAQHKAVIDAGVLGKEWTVLAIFPSPMLYAGPREVQWHARARVAAGIDTYIVGRDPAGIADPDSPSGAPLYEPSHGAKILSMAPGLSHLNIIPFRVAAYDTKAKKMAMLDDSRKGDFLFISGTKMRQFARDGEEPPKDFMCAPAWKILAEHYKKTQPS